MYEVESLLNASLEPDNSRAPDFIFEVFFVAALGEWVSCKFRWYSAAFQKSASGGLLADKSNERRFLRSFGRSS
jgi:hypothetical protein